MKTKTTEINNTKTTALRDSDKLDRTLAGDSMDNDYFDPMNAIFRHLKAQKAARRGYWTKYTAG